MNKVIIFLERMWATVAIVCLILAIYKSITIGWEDGAYFFVFSILATLLWYLRRRIRRRMQQAGENNKDNSDERSEA